jgi:hypothetical protein
MIPKSWLKISGLLLKPFCVIFAQQNGLYIAIAPNYL